MSHSFSVYNASAGSGKTYTLAKEYIKILLLSPYNDSFSSILAITFTNKAVGEMKKRILEYLIDFSEKNIHEDNLSFFNDIISETGLNEENIFNKSKLVLNTLLQNYANFDISTIDKFTLKLVKNFALDLGLNTQFEVYLDEDYLQEQAIDLMISQTGEDEEITKIVMEYAKNQINDDNSWDLTNNIKNVTKLLEKETFREQMQAFKNKSLAEIIEVKNNLAKENANLKNEIIKNGKKIQQIIKEIGIPDTDFDRQTFPNYLVKVVSFNLAIKDLKTFDSIKLKKSSKFTKDNLTKEFEECTVFIYKKYHQYILNQEFINNFIPLSLLNKVVLKISEIEEIQNVMLLSKFNQLIYNEIINQPALYIFERIGERYKHFFIDEFQDTSELQWFNLVPLLDNAISSEDSGNRKGTVMVVGDPKQSIYRFRGGKPEMLLDISKNNDIKDKKQNPFNTSDKIVENLDTNYRSYSNVINFNNDFFKFIAQDFENEDYKDLYQNFSHQKLNSKIGGCVTLSFSNQGNLESEEELEKDDLMIEQVYERIKKCKKNGFQYNEIAILVHKNINGVLIAKKLIQEGIKVISAESLLLKSSDAVMTIINFLKLIQNNKDESILSEFIYQLYFLNPKLNTSNNSVFKLTKEALDFCKNDSLENWLNNHEIQINIEQLKSKPIYTTVQEIIDILLNYPKNNAYLQSFLELVWDKSINSKLNIQEFLEHFNQKSDKLSISAQATSDAVIILSIHKSKGLEFPVVIYPFANQQLNAHTESLFLPIENQTIEFGLVNQNKYFSNINETMKNTLNQVAEEQKMDTINKLYVALTRAKEQLHVISTMKLNKGNIINEHYISKYFLQFLDYKKLLNFEKFEYIFGDLQRVSNPKKIENSSFSIENIKKRLKFNQIKIAKNNALLWGSKQKEAIDFGNFIHDLMENIHTKNDISKVIKEAVLDGKIDINDNNLIENTLLKIVTHHDLTIFYNENATVLNEQKIIIPQKNILIPDRLVFYQDKMYILDYKTGKKENHHVSQILSYKEILETMQYQVAQSVLVYINDEIEVVNL